jgi:hypothetical protein
MDLITQRFPVVKVMVDGEVLNIQFVWDSKSNRHNVTLWVPGFMLDDIGDVKEMVIKWLAVPVAVYLIAGLPPQDYSLSAGTFTKSKQEDIDDGAMFNNFLTHPTERHALGVRIIHTQTEGVYERMSFGSSVPCILEGGLLLISRAKGNVEFLSFARVIIMTQTTIGNGKLCILLSLGVLGMTHPSPGSFSYGKMESWLLGRPTMLTAYIRP